MTLEILTPKKIELKQETEAVIVPSFLGQLCLLPGHAPLISALTPGTIRVNGKSFEIEGGILEVDNNKVTILLKNFNVR
jgi:F-type H+-transporting ATPase subunit epsilon